MARFKLLSGNLLVVGVSLPGIGGLNADANGVFDAELSQQIEQALADHGLQMIAEAEDPIVVDLRVSNIEHIQEVIPPPPEAPPETPSVVKERVVLTPATRRRSVNTE